MRPTFLGFETAKMGLNVSQKRLDIVGNNLSNIDTPGYTRQRVDVTSVAPSAHSTRVSSSRFGVAGQGVQALGVSQTRDSFLDKRFRDEYSSASYYSQSANILNDIQSALGDANNVSEGGDVFMKAMEQIYSALNDFSGDPTSVPHANLVLSAFNNATQVIRQLDTKLLSVADQQKFDLGVNIERANDVLEQIAHLNEAISKDTTVLSDPENEYFRPNELMDKRNLLLDELASYGDISVKEHQDGSVDVTMGGHQVIKGGVHERIVMDADDTTDVVMLYWSSNGDEVNLGGGALKGYTDFINGRGANIQNPGETNKQGVLYYRDRLDTMARTLANVINNIVPEMVEDPNAPADSPDRLIPKTENGNIVYKEFLSAQIADGSTDINTPISASNIAISDKWLQGGAAYFVYDPGSKDPKYGQQISNALSASPTKFVSYGETFTGTFYDYLIDYTGKIGTDTSFYEGRRDVTAGVADDFLNRRDEVAGVSENEETVDMMTFQKSFSAASRLMTALDELLEILINRTGRVGL